MIKSIEGGSKFVTARDRHDRQEVIYLGSGERKATTTITAASESQGHRRSSHPQGPAYHQVEPSVRVGSRASAGLIHPMRERQAPPIPKWLAPFHSRNDEPRPIDQGSCSDQRSGPSWREHQRTSLSGSPTTRSASHPVSRRTGRNTSRTRRAESARDRGMTSRDGCLSRPVLSRSRPVALQAVEPPRRPRHRFVRPHRYSPSRKTGPACWRLPHP